MIAERGSDSEVAQNLNDLSVLGRQNAAALAAVGFPVSRIAEAAEASDVLAVRLAEAELDRRGDDAVKLVRDQAYTHLKEAVDAVREHGQYVFWKESDKARGYASAYARRSRRASARKEANAGTAIDLPAR